MRRTDTPSSSSDTKPLDRRSALRALGAGLCLLPLAKLTACSWSDESTGGAAGSGAAGSGTAGSGTAGSGTAGSGTAGGGAAGAAGSGTAGSSSGTAWATGGTAAMTGKSSYPDPFASGTGSTCTLTCSATIGPCHTTSPMRQDVSDGWNGIPLRLSLKVVDESCKPVAGAIVEIWHTNHKGIYSGSIASLCNSAAEDKAAMYFRGYLTTDASGRVDFDTCFPGWYSSRAIHIHFRVMTGTYDPSDSAQASVISQLFFTDELVGQIFANEPLYKDKGQPDTLLGTDNVIGGTSDKTPYVCDIQKMADGTMLASKTVILKSTSASSCSLQGSGGGMGPGGMP